MAHARLSSKRHCNLTLPPHPHRVPRARKNLSKNTVLPHLNRIFFSHVQVRWCRSPDASEVTGRSSNGQTLQYPDALPRSPGFVVRLRRKQLCDSRGRNDHISAGARWQGGQRLCSWVRTRLWPRSGPRLLRPGLRLLWRPHRCTARSPLLVECLRCPRLPLVKRLDRRV
jgi:hypothetical protein